MLYTVPTKRGLGIQLWGNYDDVILLYEIIGKFWNEEQYKNKKDYDNRDSLISSFSHELRKCYQGSRLKRNQSHFSSEPMLYFGAEFSWVHVLFSLSALKFNMRFQESNKLDLSVFMLIEFWLEKSMNDFDEVGARKLIPFINDGIYPGNKYLYQFMRSINADYFLLGGGKSAFRKLPDLLTKAILNHNKYNEYITSLTMEAQRLKCEIYDLEINDDDIDYKNIKW